MAEPIDEMMGWVVAFLMRKPWRARLFVAIAVLWASVNLYFALPDWHRPVVFAVLTVLLFEGIHAWRWFPAWLADRRARRLWK